MELVIGQYRDRYTFEDVTTHTVKISRDPAERDRLFMAYTHGCKRRDGREWKNVHGSVVVKDVFFWLMENIGPPYGMVWECDRIYYPDETPPELPLGGRAGYARAFECYADNRFDRWWCASADTRSEFRFSHRTDALAFMLAWS